MATNTCTSIVYQRFMLISVFGPNWNETNKKHINYKSLTFMQFAPGENKEIYAKYR